MTELEKLERAKMYIDSLADGVNPLDKSRVSDSDIINNVRISRCLFYVSDILRQVIENGGVGSPVRFGGKKPFDLSPEQRQSLIPDDGVVTVKNMTEKINSLIDESNTVKLKATTIGAWLVSIEMLEIVTDEKGKNAKRPTEAGRAAGIYTEERIGQYGAYTIVCYSKEAQQFIFDNIDALAYQNTVKLNKENQGTAWDPIQDELLKDLFSNGAEISEIALSLKRSKGAIKARLKKHGFIVE